MGHLDMALFVQLWFHLHGLGLTQWILSRIDVVGSWDISVTFVANYRINPLVLYSAISFFLPSLVLVIFS
ncbi:hypothetical protein LOK49_LG06G03336 [Camellia lanceoleosa]|uniref:Uncharacterized protein n=1 Tax=Camellia lanceoleosa TaxID=1840588 RepID=A0ACC0H898_9ERIC|nr:hypothetical protein LOK49_LG06G03336 [Camellia lanceoleosa]